MVLPILASQLTSTGLSKSVAPNPLVNHWVLPLQWTFRVHPIFRPQLWMEEILYQLIGGLSHCYRISSIPGGAGFLPPTVEVNLGEAS